MTKHAPLAGILLALAAASFYGFIPASTRLAFEHGVSVLDVALFRTSVMIPAMVIIARIARMPLVIPPHLRRLFIGQALATFLISTGYLASVTFIPVGLAVILFYTYPVIIVLAAPLVEGTRLNAAKLAIVLIAFAGLALAIGPRFDTLNLIGVALALLGAVSVAAQFFTARKLGAGLAAPVMAVYVHAAIWPAILILALYFGGGTLSLLTPAGLSGAGLAGLVMVGVCYVFAYGLHMASLAAAPASTVAPFFNWEPILSIIMAGVFLGERLKPMEYAGGGLVLLALVLSALEGRRKQAASAPAAA
jgi:drug/metabolite transporter (DMT)-like permease